MFLAVVLCFVVFQEFVKALKGLDLNLSDFQIYELMRTMDLDSSGFIDFAEFTSVRSQHSLCVRV